MKNTLLLLCVLAGAVLWIFDLQRRLQAAQMRGDMYRDISARLDKRIAELTANHTK
jgi:hypoxanthine-guanine phosphoribosyltransferase